MKIGIDPSIDFAFKKLFGSEENKALLLDLVNAVLEESKEKKIVDLELLNPYNLKAFQSDKLSILDIKAKDESQQWFIIEMQIIMSDYFPKRVLYYWARNYHSQLNEKQQYDRLKKVTLISLSKEPLPLPTSNYWNLWRLLSVHDHSQIFSPDLNIYTIELSKFEQSTVPISSLQRWAYFLKHGADLDEDALPPTLETPIMKHAVHELRKFTLNEIEREIYESRLMAILDEKSRLSERYSQGIAQGREEGREEGKKEGREEGKKEGREEAILATARNMIRGNLETALIMKFTGLDLATIDKIRKQEM